VREGAVAVNVPDDGAVNGPGSGAGAAGSQAGG